MRSPTLHCVGSYDLFGQKRSDALAGKEVEVRRTASINVGMDGHEARKEPTVSLLFALLTAIVLIVWSTMRKRAPQRVFLRRYVHPCHTWMCETEDGDVLVGIDEFAQSLIGIDREDRPCVPAALAQEGEAGKSCVGSEAR